jgi:hypothetical protein
MLFISYGFIYQNRIRESKFSHYRDSNMQRKNLFTLILTVGLTACASIKPTLYDPSALQSVRSWTVDFTYETGRTEEAVSQEKGAETRVVREGRPGRELKLRDDLVFLLKDQHKFDVARTRRSGAGEIHLLPIDFGSGGFKSVDVELVLPNGEMVGRVQIKNGDRNATFKDDDAFTEYVANAIADAIRGRK